MHVLFDELTLLLRMMYRMMILSWDLLGKISCQLKKKARIPKRDQALDLIPRQRGKVLNKQGELRQSPVWNRKPQTIQNQAPEQAQKQDLELFLS